MSDCDYQREKTSSRDWDHSTQNSHNGDKSRENSYNWDRATQNSYDWERQIHEWARLTQEDSEDSDDETQSIISCDWAHSKQTRDCLTLNNQDWDDDTNTKMVASRDWAPSTQPKDRLTQNSQGWDDDTQNIDTQSIDSQEWAPSRQPKDRLTQNSQDWDDDAQSINSQEWVSSSQPEDHLTQNSQDWYDDKKSITRRNWTRSRLRKDRSTQNSQDSDNDTQSIASRDWAVSRQPKDRLTQNSQDWNNDTQSIGSREWARSRQPKDRLTQNSQDWNDDMQSIGSREWARLRQPEDCLTQNSQDWNDDTQSIGSREWAHSRNPKDGLTQNSQDWDDDTQSIVSRDWARSRQTRDYLTQNSYDSDNTTRSITSREWAHSRQTSQDWDHVEQTSDSHRDYERHTRWSALSRQSAVDYPYDEGRTNICILQYQFGEDWPGELQSGFGVAVRPSNGDIFITDRKTAQVKVYDQDGDAKLNIDTKVGLRPALLTKDVRKSYPKGIVINPTTEDIMITDHVSVKVFDASSEYDLKYTFPAISPSGKSSEAESDSFLAGLTIDVNYRLLVGEVHHYYISKHHVNGKHISTVKVRIAPQFIVATPGKIIISPWDLNASIHVLDYTGKLLHELTPPSEIFHLWYPSGLCVSQGTIFVSNVLGIFCFSVEGEYLGCATRQVSSPLGLALQEDKKLFVVERTGHCVKVFKLKY